jgi:hypothetical protein
MLHEQPDVSRDSTTVASQTPAHRQGYTAVVRLLPLTAAATVQCSAVSHTATQRHSITAIQRRSNARSLLHTAAHGNQRATYTQTPKQTASQLHTPLHCTLNVLISTVVTRNGGAVLHTRPRLRAAASSAATPDGTHITASTVLQSLPRRILQQCDAATATCTITGHVSH